LKRYLQFLLIQIAPLLDEWRLQTLARQHGIRKDRETNAIDKLFAAFVRRADEGALARLLVESSPPSSWQRPVPMPPSFSAMLLQRTQLNFI
jgi:hypothetical protein